MNGRKQSPGFKLEVLDDAGYLVERLVEATGLSIEQVVARLQKENRELGVNVREDFDRRGLTRYTWSEQLNEFYDNTDAFLFETIMWNRTEAKQAMREWIARFLQTNLDRPARLLTFGDGLGFDSLYLALAGHQLDYFEVSKRGIQFASGLFRKYDAEVNMLTSRDEVQAGQYDAVVCLDVLEHIPSPSQIVGFLSNALRDNGFLLSHAPFWYLGPAVVTHLRENRRYSGDLRRLYHPHGLRAFDGDWMWNPIALQKTNSKRPTELPIGRRVRLGIGGYLLWWGRFWSAFHIFGAKRLVKSKPWPELDAFE